MSVSVCVCVSVSPHTHVSVRESVNLFYIRYMHTQIKAYQAGPDQFNELISFRPFEGLL